MSVLVTGGCGFIGSNIVRILLEKGYNVYVLDNYFLGKRENVEILGSKYRGKIKIIEGDVRDTQLLSDIIKKCDYVIHEAAVSSAPMFNKDPREGIYVNISGFCNVLELSRRFGIKKVVYASTSSLYSAFSPPHREDLPVYPRTFYEYTMFAREHMARIYYETYGLRSVGMRYFSIYGPNELHKLRYANIITQFLWRMLKNKPPVIYGDGSQTRDFTYVEDAAIATIMAMENEDVECDVLNVGTGRETTFKQIVKLLNNALGKNIEPIYVENPIKKYVYRTCADITKIQRVLGFKPKVTVEEGIERQVRTYSALIDKIPEDW